MKKGPDEDYKEYVVRWKNAASMVRPPFTSREENSKFVDTLPSSYYDMLVVNAFMEFRDLMYPLGRIKDGIKKGKIMDIETTMFGKKGNVPNTHIEKWSRRKFEAMGESVRNLFHLRTPCTQVPPIRCFSPQVSAWKNNQGSNLGYYQRRKGKGPKPTIHFQCLIQSCSPYWFRIMGFLSFPQGLGDLHIQKSMMSMLNVNTMEELGGTPWRITHHSRTRFNRWLTQIQPNSEDLSTVIISIKIKDQLGAVFVMNVFIRECAFWEM